MEKHGEEMVFEITFSKASTYNKCPAKYKYRYIDKLPEEPSYYLVFGSIFHEAIKSVIENAFKYHLLEMLDVFDVEAETNSILNTTLKTDSDYALSAEDTNTLKRMIENTYKRYVESSFINGYLVKSEENISIYKSDLPITVGLHTYYPVFRGRIDIVLEKEKEIKIVEMKTGSNSSFVEKDENISEERMQAVLYAEAYARNKNIGKEQINVEIYYPKEDLVITVEKKDAIIDFANSYLSGAVKGILEKRFERRESNLCNFCAFAKVCLKNDDSSFFGSGNNSF